MKREFRILLTVLFFLIGALRLIIPISQNFGKFTEKFNPALYEKKYNASQYMVPRSKNPISDEELLSHAGYKYIHGLNPILINSDHPPLGKYIIGFFTLMTGNNRTVSLVFGILNLLLLSVIIFKTTRSLFHTGMGFLFLTFDPMLVDQIVHSPILDIIQVSFLLLYILLFLFWRMNFKKLHYVVIMAITLGCLSSIKLYFPAIVLIGVTGLTILASGKTLLQTLNYVSITFPIAFLTYAATYFKFFLETKSFFTFFGMQKWIFLFWQNNSVNQTKAFGNVIPLVLFNKWHVWWGDVPYINYSGWTVIWPVFFILGAAASVYFLINRKAYRQSDKHMEYLPTLLGLWFVCFTAYLCFVPISPRYLLMLYFPTYILTVLFVYNTLKKPSHVQKKH